MKAKLPDFTPANLVFASVLVLACIAGYRAVGQDVTSRPQPPSAQDASATQSGQIALTSDGNRLLAGARQVMAEHASVAAKIRQQADVLGERLVGSGALYQWRDGNQMLVRMELKIQTAGEVSSYLQVADGRYLWTDRQILGERSIARIDLRRLMRDGESAYPPAFAQSPQPALGGLNELLAGLAENFQVAQVKQGELRKFPVYVLTCRWRTEALQQLLHDENEAEKHAPLKPNDIPAHMPQEVVITLGRDDLFPYEFDYRRYEPSRAGQGGAKSKPHSLVRMQLFEVRLGGPIDSRQFVYTPGPVDVADQTDALLEKLNRKRP